MIEPPAAFASSNPNEPEPATRKPIAIFVCHGMGQQVHFETIEGVVNALLREQGRQEAMGKGKTPPLKRLFERPPRAHAAAQAELVELGGSTVMRARVTLNAAGESREVHVYEGYWAPLPEGKINVWQVLAFLFSAALLGIWNCLRSGGFVRFMFRKREVFGGLHLAGLALLASLAYFMVALLVGPVLLVNAVTFSGLISLLFPKGGVSGIRSSVLGAGTWYIARIEMFLFWIGVATVILPKLYSLLRRHILLWRIVANWLIRPAALLVTGWSLVGLFFGSFAALENLARYAIHYQSGTGAAGVGIAQHMAFEPWPQFLYVWLSLLVHALARWTHIPYSALRISIVWVMALVFGYFVQWFLVEFVGDVAIYTSSYKLSVFDEVRDKIRTAALSAARPIYAATRGGQNARSLLYDDVLVLGHSLGSVIAYDTLNTLICEDQLSPNPAGVAGRTRLLLTFGSPLDKIAFIFRTHSSKTHEFRENAAEQLQPLIQDYADRPEHWINIWSAMDIISGRLRFFDDRDRTRGGTKRVQNVVDKEVWVPFAAHTEYWQDTLFVRTLYAAIFEIR